MFEELKPHLRELRIRLFKSVLCVFVFFLISFSFWKIILQFMILPLQKVLPKGSNIIFTQIQEPLFTALKVSFFTGLLISMPVIFYQFWRFIAPGLYDNEKRYVVPFVLSATLMFILGAGFCYFLVIPMAFKFLVDFGGELFKALPSIGTYVGFFTKVIIGFGLSFELPNITFFLAKLGLIDDAFLKRHFKIAIVIIFTFSAIMTPPDVISQFMMAGPLLVLYLISILIAKRTNPAKKKDEEDLD